MSEDTKPGVSDESAAPPKKRARCVQRRRELAKEANLLQMFVAEPFRIFFPLALLVSVVAVMLWPAMFWGWITTFYPKDMHGRLLMEGFVGGFALGFMGTAMPNVLTARKFTAAEIVVLLVLYLAMIACHLAQKLAWGDGLFLAMILVFSGGLVWRFAKREDMPPPGFVLVGGGLLCAVVGASLFLLDQLGAADPERTRLANLLLYQGFLLLPVLGIGAFLFPRFFGTKNSHILPDSRTPGPGWMAKAVIAAMAGVALVATFVLEAQGHEKPAAWARFAVCAMYLSTETGWWRKPDKGGIMPWGLRLGILFTIGVYLVHGVLHAGLPVYPLQTQVAISHMLYVGGFGLLALVVGTRVMLGHAGQSHLMQRWLKPVVWMVALVVLAALTRVTADFMPKPETVFSHWRYAAWSWVLGVLIWGVFLLPWVLRPDDEEDD